nr:MAG TPA: hypothetical protein [Caudoviricetes sp.]
MRLNTTIFTNHRVLPMNCLLVMKVRLCMMQRIVSSRSHQ